VSVAVAPSTNQEANRAPWGLGANFVEFLPDSPGTLTVTFDGEDGFAWRAEIVAIPARGNGAAVESPMTLKADASGSFTLPDFGSRWSKVVLVPTIAAAEGREVPYSYSATVK
jgi:hypothetical protein